MTYDAAVVGGGVMGAATSLSLARRGLSVVNFEQYESPHDKGSSHGESRLLRTAYAEGEAYVPLAHKSIGLWREIEQLSGASLFYQTGVFYAGETQSPFLKSVQQSSQEHHLPLKEVSGAEASTLISGLKVPKHWRALFEPDGGYLLAEDCVEALGQLCDMHNVERRSNTLVRAVEADGEAFRIETGNASVLIKQVVLCCGPWIANLVPEIRSSLTLERKVLHWFACEPGTFSIENGFKPFCVDDKGQWRYAFPEVTPGTVKVADHYSGEVVEDMASLDRTPPQDDDIDVAEFVRKFLPDLGKRLRSEVCVYTMSPDEHFAIGEHPAKPGLFIATGFSGHGFKFAPAIGELMADLAENKTSIGEDHLFSLTRLFSA